MKEKTRDVLAAAILIAIMGTTAAFSMTWTENSITMTAGSASLVSIGIFQDCAATVPFTSYDWDGVVEGQQYEVTMYVKNTGKQAVYITYSPADQGFPYADTRFRIEAYIIEGPGTSCQLLPTNPTQLSVKNPLVCENGFLLNPGKVVKISVELFIDSLVTGGHWSWDFFVAGCAP